VLLLVMDLTIAVRTVIANFRFDFRPHEKLARRDTRWSRIS
jgi:hypothetical protein